MPQSKETLTEQEATSYFIRDITKSVKDAWPSINKDIQDLASQLHLVGASFEDEEMASFNFLLAVISQDLEAVSNLYDKDQAVRIEELVLNCFKYKDEKFIALGEYAVEEIKEYRNKLHSDPEPLYAITVRLLQRLFGKNYPSIKVNINGKSYIDPIILSMINPLITNCCGFWKTARDNYNLIEGGLSDNIHLNTPTFSSLTTSYVELLHPHYDELCRIISSIDEKVCNHSAIGIFVAHIAITKIKISKHPEANKIVELFLEKWINIILSLVPPTDKCTNSKQWIADLTRTMPFYTPRLANTLKPDSNEEDRYNEVLYMTVDLHHESTRISKPPDYFLLLSASQVVHRIALDILDDIQVPVIVNHSGFIDNIKNIFNKKMVSESANEKKASNHKSNLVNTSSESNPIKLFRPPNFDTAVAKSAALFKESGKFPKMNELPNEAFGGMFSEKIKMLWLETKLGEEGSNYDLGNREYIKGTSIQKQIVVFKNGTKEAYYFDFSSFGEKF
jgi:hypothetical protein